MAAIPVYVFDSYSGLSECPFTHTLTTLDIAGSFKWPSSFVHPMVLNSLEYTVTLDPSLYQTPGDYTFYYKVEAGASEIFSPLITLRTKCGPTIVTPSIKSNAAFMLLSSWAPWQRSGDDRGLLFGMSAAKR